MRRTLCVGGMILLAVAIVGCDSEDPAAIPGQEFAFTVLTSNQLVTTFYVWSFFRDGCLDAGGQPTDCTPGGNQPEPPDMMPDDATFDGVPDIWLYCLTALPGDSVSASSIPWLATMRVQLLPAGQTERVEITPDSGTVFPYDTTPVVPPPNPAPGFGFTDVPANPSVAGCSPQLCEIPAGSGVFWNLVYTREYITTAANEQVMAAEDNPLAADPVYQSTFTLAQGLCSARGSYSGAPRIDGFVREPYSRFLNTGDTVFVDFEGSIEPPLSTVMPALLNNPGSVLLQAEITLDGRPLTEVRGTTFGATDFATQTPATFAFSFTLK